MSDTIGKSRTASLLSCLPVTVLVLLLLPANLFGQSSQPVPQPDDTRQPIRFNSRLIEHWYDSPKMHVFMLLDGVRIQQGQWRLKARDAVIWFDEAAAAKGVITLGIYAEGDVEISGPAFPEPRQYEFVYLTLATTGEIERSSQVDRELSRADTPLFLRAKRMRQRALEAQPQPPLVPEQTPGTAETAPAPPESAPPLADESPLRIIIRPRDEMRPTTMETSVENGRRVTIWTGGILIIYGDMELLADDAVIWTNDDEEVVAKVGQQPEVYLEGDVVINVGREVAGEVETSGNTQLRATRVFADLDRNLALIFDAQIRAFARGRQIPLYYYAERARQVGQGHFLAERGTFTTSRMGHPQVGLHGSSVELIDMGGRDEVTGEAIRRIRYDIRNVVTTAHGVPILWWPKMSGDVEQHATALRRVNLTQSSSRGTGIESQWHLWRLFGIGDEPEGFRKTYLNMNFYGDRGPYVGVESQYLRENFYGNLLTNLVYDTGTDRIFGERLDAPRKTRGRASWQHRQFLPRDWQATAEVSYLSDRQFLPEWFESEDQQAKDQETLLHLKKQPALGIESFSLLAKMKINDWQTETQYAPRIEYHRLGQPLWDTGAAWFTNNTYQYSEYSPDEDLAIGDDSPWSNIADTRHWFNAPLQVGFVKIVPFVEGRLSYFENRIDGRGSDVRTFGAAGFGGSWYLTRQYNDISSRFWDVNRIRHVNTFDFRLMQADTNLPSRHLHPWDEPGSAETKLVRGIDSTDVYQAGWRQRWQTKRGPTQRTVDLVTFDMIATWYSDVREPRVSPDDDIARNNITADYSWQISDTTSLVGDLYYTTSDGHVRLSNIGLAVVRSPRFTYYIGNRYIRGAGASMLTFGFDYVINRKYSMHFFEQFDVGNDNYNSSTRVQLVRNGESWKTIFSFELNPGRDESIFLIQFQPIGVPEISLGN